MEQTGLKRNLSRVELGVSAVIITTLLVYAINRMDSIYAFTEMNGTNVLIRNLKSSVSLFVSEKIIQGEIDSLAEIVNANPVNIVFPEPPEYAGVLQDNTGEIIKGRWYYDSSSNELVYYVKNDDYFLSDEPGPARIRLSMKLIFSDYNNNNIFDKGTDKVRGLSLVYKKDYSWSL